MDAVYADNSRSTGGNAGSYRITPTVRVSIFAVGLSFAKFVTVVFVQTGDAELSIFCHAFYSK
jgi:hypothetical protein